MALLNSLKEIMTDRFVRYANQNGIGVMRLEVCLERCDKEETSIENVDHDVFTLLSEFLATCPMYDEERMEFISTFKLPKGKYFHSASACLEHIAEENNIQSGDKIVFTKTYGNEDKIESVLIINDCQSIIATYIIL